MVLTRPAARVSSRSPSARRAAGTTLSGGTDVRMTGKMKPAGTWRYGAYAATRLSARIPKFLMSSTTPTITRHVGSDGSPKFTRCPTGLESVKYRRANVWFTTITGVASGPSPGSNDRPCTTGIRMVPK